MNLRLATGLRKVIGSHLFRSGLGHVWKDERTWLELARELVEALKGSVVIVEQKEYDRLVAEANQMKVVRSYVAEYQARLPKEKRAEKVRNPYARWAAENMTPKEGA